MTEFWIHTPKHYCKYCNIYIDDNKPSILHHERGARHQENMKKHMQGIQDKQREENDIQKEVERMKAAAAAYSDTSVLSQDVVPSAGDATQPAIGCEMPPPGLIDAVHQLHEPPKAGTPGAPRAGGKPPSDAAKEREMRELHQQIYRKFQVHPDWVATTDNTTGAVYYYNKFTGATQWNRPMLTETEIQEAEHKRILEQQHQERLREEAAEQAQAAFEAAQATRDLSAKPPEEFTAPAGAMIPPSAMLQRSEELKRLDEERAAKKAAKKLQLEAHREDDEDAANAASTDAAPEDRGVLPQLRAKQPRDEAPTPVCHPCVASTPVWGMWLQPTRDEAPTPQAKEDVSERRTRPRMEQGDAVAVPESKPSPAAPPVADTKPAIADGPESFIRKVGEEKRRNVRKGHFGL
ncbi:putative WW domain-binding protein 4 [Paratrimastix pyriformis]|uniref:WW domain-binding protein 4 n=1 Tax=Paratrimastix pyriformis TaxID=342808 RepID=A0ABQ8U4D9_9EUKA|nr:putative WW domain-binding protein 4 [Paratrimastix pyriformis]